MNRLCTFLITFLSVLVLGCGSLRNEVDPAFLNREASKLVVTCFLSPQDTILAVKVTRSQTVLGDSVNNADNGASTNIPGAIVTLADGDRKVTLSIRKTASPYSNSDEYYSANARDLPIIAGHVYKLTVQTPDGQRAESTCTIPGLVNLTRVTFDSTTVNQILRSQRRYFVRGHWQDPAGQANYYQLTGTFQYINARPDTARRVEYRIFRFDNPTSSLQTDTDVNGSAMASERAYLNRLDNSTRPSNFADLYRSAVVTVNLLNIDQAYYNYQYAVGRQAQSSGNPFAEPVLIPSNIQGGLGCFAGYNRSTITLRLK